MSEDALSTIRRVLGINNQNQVTDTEKLSIGNVRIAMSAAANAEYNMAEREQLLERTLTDNAREWVPGLEEACRRLIGIAKNENGQYIDSDKASMYVSKDLVDFLKNYVKTRIELKQEAMFKELNIPNPDNLPDDSPIKGEIVRAKSDLNVSRNDIKSLASKINKEKCNAALEESQGSVSAKTDEIKDICQKAGIKLSDDFATQLGKNLKDKIIDMYCSRDNNELSVQNDTKSIKQSIDKYLNDSLNRFKALTETIVNAENSNLITHEGANAIKEQIAKSPFKIKPQILNAVVENANIADDLLNVIWNKGCSLDTLFNPIEEFIGKLQTASNGLARAGLDMDPAATEQFKDLIVRSAISSIKANYGELSPVKLQQIKETNTLLTQNDLMLLDEENALSRGEGHLSCDTFRDVLKDFHVINATLQGMIERIDDTFEQSYVRVTENDFSPVVKNFLWDKGVAFMAGAPFTKPMDQILCENFTADLNKGLDSKQNANDKNLLGALREQCSSITVNGEVCQENTDIYSQLSSLCGDANSKQLANLVHCLTHCNIPLLGDNVKPAVDISKQGNDVIVRMSNQPGDAVVFSWTASLAADGTKKLDMEKFNIVGRVQSFEHQVDGKGLSILADMNENGLSDKLNERLYNMMQSKYEPKEKVESLVKDINAFHLNNLKAEGLSLMVESAISNLEIGNDKLKAELQKQTEKMLFEHLESSFLNGDKPITEEALIHEAYQKLNALVQEKQAALNFLENKEGLSEQVKNTLVKAITSSVSFNTTGQVVAFLENLDALQEFADTASSLAGVSKEQVADAFHKTSQKLMEAKKNLGIIHPELSKSQLDSLPGEMFVLAMQCLKETSVEGKALMLTRLQEQNHILSDIQDKLQSKDATGYRLVADNDSIEMLQMQKSVLTKLNTAIAATLDADMSMPRESPKAGTLPSLHQHVIENLGIGICRTKPFTGEVFTQKLGNVYNNFALNDLKSYANEKLQELSNCSEAQFRHHMKGPAGDLTRHGQSMSVNGNQIYEITGNKTLAETDSDGDARITDKLIEIFNLHCVNSKKALIVIGALMQQSMQASLTIQANSTHEYLFDNFSTSSGIRNFDVKFNNDGSFTLGVDSVVKVKGVKTSENDEIDCSKQDSFIREKFALNISFDEAGELKMHFDERPSIQMKFVPTQMLLDEDSANAQINDEQDYNWNVVNDNAMKEEDEPISNITKGKLWLCGLEYEFPGFLRDDYLNTGKRLTTEIINKLLHGTDAERDDAINQIRDMSMPYLEQGFIKKLPDIHTEYMLLTEKLGIEQRSGNNESDLNLLRNALKENNPVVHELAILLKNGNDRSLEMARKMLPDILIKLRSELGMVYVDHKMKLAKEVRNVLKNDEDPLRQQRLSEALKHFYVQDSKMDEASKEIKRIFAEIVFEKGNNWFNSLYSPNASLRFISCNDAKKLDFIKTKLSKIIDDDIENKENEIKDLNRLNNQIIFEKAGDKLTSKVPEDILKRLQDDPNVERQMRFAAALEHFDEDEALDTAGIEAQNEEQNLAVEEMHRLYSEILLEDYQHANAQQNNLNP